MKKVPNVSRYDMYAFLDEYYSMSNYYEYYFIVEIKPKTIDCANIMHGKKQTLPNAN